MNSTFTMKDVDFGKLGSHDLDIEYIGWGTEKPSFDCEGIEGGVEIQKVMLYGCDIKDHLTDDRLEELSRMLKEELETRGF